MTETDLYTGLCVNGYLLLKNRPSRFIKLLAHSSKEQWTEFFELKCMSLFIFSVKSHEKQTVSSKSIVRVRHSGLTFSSLRFE